MTGLLAPLYLHLPGCRTYPYAEEMDVSNLIKQRLQGCGAVLHELSRAQARWDIEISGQILRRRKWVLAAALSPVAAALLLQAAHAAGLLPEKIPVLGISKQAYMPLFITNRMFFGSILVGLVAGLITGVIGAGGGYVLTPALMSFGVRGIMAVGTDQFHLFAKAIMGTGIHRKLGNVNLALAAWFVLGSVPGARIGASISRAAYEASPAMSDALISAVYVVVLGALGLYAINDWLRLRRGQDTGSSVEATTAFAKRLQAVRLRPRIRFDQDIVEGGRSISVYPVVACGLIVGFVASIMGVGGGFLTFPMFVYGLGVSTFTTVGTDILQIIFTAGYSSIWEYARHGFVFYSVAIGMLLGSLIGVQIGAMVTKLVKGSVIRALYALTILAGFVNRVCALIRKLSDLGYLSLTRETTQAIESAGTVVFFAIVGVFALWILTVFVTRVSAIRAADAADEGASASLVRHPAKFRAGVAGLCAFAVVMLVAFRPVGGHRTALDWADNLFNRLAKNSANFLDEIEKKARGFRGVGVDLGVRARDVWEPRKAVAVAASRGIEAKALPDGRVRINGDLGTIAEAAIADARVMFDNGRHALSDSRGIESTEVVYYWWTVFQGLTRRYVQEGEGREAAFTKLVMTKALEPAFNFRGIDAAGIGSAAVPAVALLVGYVIFTLWYGVSIFLIFEGLGISASGIKEKKEV